MQIQKCNYCNNSHGLIGDVICPFLNRFPNSYSSKKVFTINETWPQALEATWDQNIYVLDPQNLSNFSDDDFRKELLAYIRSKNSKQAGSGV